MIFILKRIQKYPHSWWCVWPPHSYERVKKIPTKVLVSVVDLSHTQNGEVISRQHRETLLEGIGHVEVGYTGYINLSPRQQHCVREIWATILCAANTGNNY